MGHYDYLHEDASRKDITEEINLVQRILDKNDTYTKDLEKDIDNITTEYSKIVIEKEIKALEHSINVWNKKLNNLNNLLKSHDDGQKILRSALR